MNSYYHVWKKMKSYYLQVSITAFLLFLFLAVSANATHYEILAFGDSLTQGYKEDSAGNVSGILSPPGGVRTSDGYEPDLEALYTETVNSAYVYNWGHGGERTDAGLNRIDSVLVSRQADYILILEGTNDILAGISTTTTAFNLSQMVLKSQEYFIEPILGTVTPNTMPEQWASGMNDIIANDLNVKIKQVALTNSVAIADLYRNLSPPPEGNGWETIFNSGDGLHLSDAGEWRIAETWFHSLAAPQYFPTGLISYWSLDEIEGSIYWDSAGINDGQCTVTCPDVTPGVVNGGQHFDGTSSIYVASDYSIDWEVDESFSFEFWMHKDSTTTENEPVVGRDDSSGQVHWWAGVGHNVGAGQARFYARDSDGNGYGVSGSTVLTDGAWHHIVAVRDASSSELRIYVDGALEGTTQTSYSSDFSATFTPMTIGRIEIGGNYTLDFIGDIDEVAVYNRVLTPDEIGTHWNNGNAGRGYYEESEYAPQITSTPPGSVILNNVYQYDVDASSFPPSSFVLDDGPLGMFIDPVTGLLEWTPDAIGIYSVTVSAYNTIDTASQSFTITVLDQPSYAPLIISTPPDSVILDNVYRYDLNATGFPSPTFVLDDGPAGMLVDPITGLLEWTPDTIGTYSVTVSAHNTIDTTSQIFSVTVLGSTPNILIIVADDLGVGDVSYNGFNTDVHTPIIDSLASEGMRFDNFYANSPVCSPTRAALLTGKYPGLVGVSGPVGRFLDNSFGYFDPSATTLADLLKSNGYYTGMIGKWHLGYKPPNLPTMRGFDYFYGFLGAAMDYYTHEGTPFQSPGDDLMLLNETVLLPNEHQGIHATELFTQNAEEFIRGRSGQTQPFLLYLSYTAPHTPIQPIQDWVDAISQREPGIDPDRAKLLALVEHMDDAIGRVLQSLKDTGLYDNTLIIFTSDNGGDLKQKASNGFYRQGKNYLYEGGIRVPFVAVWPGEIAENSNNQEVALTMDLFPTILEAAGVTFSHEIDGDSLLPLLKEQSVSLPDRNLIWEERGWQSDFRFQTYYAARTSDFKLVQANPLQPFELYDLIYDPSEENDISLSEPNTASDLEKILTDYQSLESQIPWAPSGTLESFMVNDVDENWVTVNLAGIYMYPVVIATPNYDDTSPPLTVRIRNAGASSFEVRVVNVNNTAANITGVDVYFFVVEEGVYTEEMHGITMEAVRYTSTITDRQGSWVGQKRNYINTYLNPVVVGQVMSENDPDFSVFWSMGANRTAAPDSTTFFTGKHVGEDADTTRTDETIGYVVIEAGAHSLPGMGILANLGPLSVSGVEGSPPYTYSLSGISEVAGVIVSQSSMVGDNGGWAMLYGPTPYSDSQINLAIDEDQLGDSERSHTSEPVAYLAFGNLGNLGNQAPVINPIGNKTVKEGQILQFNVIANDLDGPAPLALDATGTAISSGALYNDSGSFTWTPVVGDSNNSPYSVTFTATEDNGSGLLAEETISITVTPACSLNPSFTEITLDNGKVYYTDRTYTLTSVPLQYAGMNSIITPNDDRNINDTSDYLTFVLPTDGNVYIAFDSRATTLPNWMNGFSDTGDVIYTSLSTQPFLKVYRREYIAGDCVNLGGNKAPGFSGGTVSNYIVFYGETPPPPATHSLTLAVVPAGTNTTSPVAGTTDYTEGTVVNVVATPDNGYKFEFWTGDVADTTAPSTTATIDADKTVTAHFSEISGSSYHLTMFVTPAGSGTTSPVAGTTAFTGETVVNLEATSEDGYQFDFWTGDVADTTAPITTVTMDAHKTITANFSAVIACDLNPKFNESTLNEGEVYYTDRTYTLTSVPLQYAGMSSIITPNDDRNINDTSDYLTFALPTDGNVYIAFDSRASTLPDWMNGFSDTGDVIYTSLSTQPFLKVYSRESLAGDCVNLGGNKAPGFSGEIVSNYIVFYGETPPPPVSHSLTLAVVPAGINMTSPVAGTTDYTEGTVVNVVATPDNGYKFDYWTGDVADTTAPSTTATIDADKTVTAHFSETSISSYHLTMFVTPAGSGTTSPVAGTTAFTAETVVNLEATSEDGYQFDYWTGDVADTTALITTVTMDAHKTITANFSAVIACDLDPKFNESTLNEGEVYYTDRTYTLTSVPLQYAGMSSIITPNDDRNINDTSDYLTFTLPTDGNVYIAFDSRASTLPDWMNGFGDTGDVIYTSLSTQPFLKVYSREYLAGDCVNLGANKAPGFSGGIVSNYTVFY